MAEAYGEPLRRLLRSAERFSERAIAAGSSWAKTFGSRSSALLSRVTRPDHVLAATTLVCRRRVNVKGERRLVGSPHELVVGVAGNDNAVAAFH